MPFTLQIRFTGLCLFVPDRKQALMQVLMPRADHPHDHLMPIPESDAGGGHHGHGAHPHAVEPHIVMVAYDAGHESDPGERLGSLVYRALTDLQLDLSGLTDDPLSYALPRDVANITRRGHGGIVRRDLLGDSPAAEVSGRVRLGGGGFSATHAGACWRYGSGAQRLTNSATWSVRVPGDALDARSLHPLRGSAPWSTLPRLRPVDGAIVLEVFNLPPRDLPPYGMPGKPPEPGSFPHHFLAYFPLFQSHHQPVLPHFEPDGCGSTGSGTQRNAAAGPADDFSVQGASIYTCMVAGGCPDDEEDCGID